jgi:hypothetical protein
MAYHCCSTGSLRSIIAIATGKHCPYSTITNVLVSRIGIGDADSIISVDQFQDRPLYTNQNQIYIYITYIYIIYIYNIYIYLSVT